jgi:POT family proton-dependent oligopeptide transporter
VIASGHYAMAIPTLETFYLGLALIVVGTGLLKPNVSTMVGALYTPEDVRRDAGFSIFYMGINIGALASPLVCGYLGENINWHYGFGAAGVGMTLGLVQYLLGGRYLGKAGLEYSGTAADRRLFRVCVAVAAALIAMGAALAVSGAVTLSSGTIYNIFGAVLMTVVIGFFVMLLSSREFTTAEKHRLWLILLLFVAASFFWGAYEQAGSTLNLFAERNTNLHAWDFPLWGLFRASYFQSFNSLFIVFGLAPLFAWFWVWLGRRNPSSTAKFSWGLLLVGLGFAILIPVAHSKEASPWWLTASYLIQTVGELCLSPVGLSAMTKLAPARIVGMMMGVWFMADSVGNFIGGQFAGYYETMDLATLFGIVAALCVAFGIVMVFLIRPMRRLTEGVN